MTRVSIRGVLRLLILTSLLLSSGCGKSESITPVIVESSIPAVLTTEVPVPEEPVSPTTTNLDIYEYALDVRGRLLECNKKLATIKER
jgi:hypothetical protein